MAIESTGKSGKHRKVKEPGRSRHDSRSGMPEGERKPRCARDLNDDRSGFRPGREICG
jgi:hypothetical protein